MNENENVPFESFPQLHTGSFLTKEQAEQFRDTFKNLTVVVRCKDCKHANYCSIHESKFSDDWFCADGERRSE